MKTNPTQLDLVPLTGSLTPGTGGARLSAVDNWVYSVLIVSADGATIYVGDSVAQVSPAGVSFPALPGCAYNLKNIWVKGATSGDVANWMAVVINQ